MSTEVRLSVAIMTHPARSGNLPELVRSCAPLEPRVVVDPDPAAGPSPLRTAKRAWAAIAEGATHHVVLQDDIVLARGFGTHLPAAVAAQPDCGITLYVNWHSVPNSYFVRRAVAAGSPWAPLSPSWTPTLGLVLPVARARQLAEYLHDIPDHVRHDDHMITAFCRERRVPIMAAVPHLLEHPGTHSLASNEADGPRHATVFTGELDFGVEHWSRGREVLPALTGRTAHREATDFAVELHNSECRIRFSRPGSGEPLAQPFGWYWYDWSTLVGVEPGIVLDDLDTFLARADHAVRRLPARLVTEVWAAGYLLGADTASLGRVNAPSRQRLLHTAMVSWIGSGLCQPDRDRLGEPELGLLVEVALAAVDHVREVVHA